MLVGGVVADRFPRALIIGSTDILLSLFVITSGVLFLTDQQSVTKLIIIAFISGTLNLSGFLPSQTSKVSGL